MWSSSYSFSNRELIRNPLSTKKNPTPKVPPFRGQLNAWTPMTIRTARPRSPSRDRTYPIDELRLEATAIIRRRPRGGDDISKTPVARQTDACSALALAGPVTTERVEVG